MFRRSTKSTLVVVGDNLKRMAMHTRSKHVVNTTDNIKLAAYMFKSESKHSESNPTLLFAHATMFHATVWQTMIKHFPQHDCVAFDFRGFGDSCKNDSFSSWLGFGDDVLSVVDHFQLTTVDGIGHSMGAAALLLAEMRRAGTFRRLVCFEPIIFPGVQPNNPQANALSKQAARRRQSFASRQDALQRLTAPHSPLSRFEPSVVLDYINDGFQHDDRDDNDSKQLTLKCDRQYESKVYMLGGANFEGLVDVHCPVLICSGAVNEGVPAQCAPLVARQLCNGTLHRFENLSHFGPLENSKQFSIVCKSFFNDAKL
jgi:lipase